jgi:hypothetical protein
MDETLNFLEAMIVGNDPWWFGVTGRCCIHPAAIGEEDSMGSDHHSILMDGPSGHPCGSRSALGLVSQLEAGTLGRLRLDHNLRCGSVCWPAGRLGL